MKRLRVRVLEEQSAEFRDDFADIEIDQSIFDVIRPAPAGRCSEFSIPGESSRGAISSAWPAALVVILRRLAPAGRSGSHCNQEQNQSCHSLWRASQLPPVFDYIVCPAAARSAAGSVELSFFCLPAPESQIAGDGQNGNGSRFRAQ